MIDLVNKLMELIPPRPMVTPEMIKVEVLSAIHHAGLSCVSDDESEETKLELAKDVVSNYHFNIDAYDLSKRMEDDGWNVNVSFVEDMRTICSYIARALQEAVMTWYRDYKPQPPLPVETKIKTGVIKGVHKLQAATYMVQRYGSEPGIYELVKFEQAVPVLSVGDVVEPVSPTYALRSGAEYFDMAVVIKSSPLILASINATMRWQSTVQAHMFRVVGEADEKTLETCLARVEV
ncbi:TPA: hypothetical protein L3N15_004181 [Vibrio parahaemolyticus]|nr:hypothetical protein [Vibrio parahaemolyticus]